MTLTRLNPVVQQELEQQAQAKKSNRNHQFGCRVVVLSTHVLEFAELVERATSCRRCTVNLQEVGQLRGATQVVYYLSLTGALKCWEALTDAMAVYDQRCDSLTYRQHVFYVPLGKRRKFVRLVNKHGGWIDQRCFGKITISVTCKRHEARELHRLAPPF